MSDDDTYEIPLQDQRVFGAGIKRKRVKFVPSSLSSISPSTSKTPSKSIGELYLNLVLPKELPSPDRSASSIPEVSSTPSTGIAALSASATTPEAQLCDVCKLPSDVSAAIATTFIGSEDPYQRVPAKSRPHEASLAHQVCLEHSHPPSHLDRNRKGLAYLSAYGWDPDARLGLGSDGQGIQFPIKPKPKDDKLGIGVVLPQRGEIRKKEKLEKLDAGKVRKMYETDKRKGEKLREMFYRNDDVERYLGGG